MVSIAWNRYHESDYITPINFPSFSLEGLVPTIRDVARRAGVAPITVSRVINNSGYVSAETRARVEAAIAELGYVPNRLARSLRVKQTNILALILSDITNPFWTTVARGVEDAASTQGFSVILCNTDESEDKELRYVQVLLEKRVDGILLVPASFETQSVSLIQQQHVPVVVLDRRIATKAVDSVRGDSVEGARRLTEHLLEQGHRRIAVLSGPRRVSTAVDRVEGYLQAMRAHGLEPDPSWVQFGSYTMAFGRQAMTYLIENGTGVTAVFAGNNFIAAGVVQALRERALRIPKDVAVAAFDDIPVNFWMSSFLTVARQPAYEMGRKATELLLKRLLTDDEGEFHELLLPVEILVRASTVAPSREAQ